MGEGRIGLAEKALQRRASFFTLLCVLYTMLSLTGCGPTYPKEKVGESIAKICKNEYKLNVKVEEAGKTIAIFAPLADLFDADFKMNTAAVERINDVILSICRVVLSTDADFNFFCLIVQDERVPEIEVIIIKRVDDVKRFLLNDISRGEYSKRVVYDMRVNKQSIKEQKVKEILDRSSHEPELKSDIMNEFFKSAPTAISDMGYWDGKFYIKDITLNEFLAEQVAARLRMDARDDKQLSDEADIKSSKGEYNKKADAAYFHFEIVIEPKWFKDFTNEEVDKKVFRKVLAIAAEVFHYYNFKDYAFIEIVNKADGRIMKVTKEELENYRNKKIRFEDIIG